jgi:hypothetical protein
MMWEISTSNDSKGTRYIAALVAFLSVLVILTSCSPGQELDGIPEHVVKAALDPKSDVIYSGVMRKQLTPMGDAAAVAVTKVLAGERPQADVVDRILLVIEISFESPQAILIQTDQKPKTAFFVLASLELQPLSTEQEKRLMQLRKKLKILASDPLPREQ